MALTFVPHQSPDDIERDLVQRQQAAFDDLRLRGFACVRGVDTLAELMQRGGTGAALVRSHASLMRTGVQRFRPSPTEICRDRPLAGTQVPRLASRRHADRFDPKRAAAGDDRDDA